MTATDIAFLIMSACFGAMWGVAGEWKRRCRAAQAELCSLRRRGPR